MLTSASYCSNSFSSIRFDYLRALGLGHFKEPGQLPLFLQRHAIF
jgi:hypothetical protein